MLDVAHSERLIHQFESHLLRATLREAHELILLYCRATSQFPLYRNLPWFQFARIIRNVVSHGDGRTLVEWPKDLRRNGVTQAVWRHRVLDAAMEGTRIHFTEAEGLELLDDKTTFAATRLQ
jgi:hypothetical protein